jgi:hypothetical protein
LTTPNRLITIVSGKLMKSAYRIDTLKKYPSLDKCGTKSLSQLTYRPCPMLLYQVYGSFSPPCFTLVHAVFVNLSSKIHRMTAHTTYES